MNHASCLNEVHPLLLPFRSSSLCDSKARSMSALFGACFGELRSPRPSIAHDAGLR